MLQKAEKESLVQKVKGLLDNSSILIVVRQNNITVSEACELRAGIRATNSSYKVVKNSLMKIAIAGTQFEPLNDSLTGQTAVVFSNSPAEAAHALADFTKKVKEKLEVVAGFYNGKMLNVADIQFLANLPSLDVLRAQIIALIKSPAQGIYSCIKAPSEQIARVVKAYSEK